MSTYFRYALGCLFRRFFLILFLIYGFFVVIDFAGKTESLDSSQVLRFYTADFFNRGAFFIPFAVLIASVSFYLQMNQKGALSAALSSGISKQRIAFPALLLAFFACLFLLATEEWGSPWALSYLERKYQEKSKKKSALNPFLSSLNLKDGSFLLYRNEDLVKKSLHDVFWIPSWDMVWHFDTVFLEEEKATTAFQYVREEGRGLFLKEIFPSLKLPWLGEEEKYLLLMQPAEMPLSELSELQFYNPALAARREPLFSSFLLKKWLFPWQPLLVVMAALPFTLVFRRRQPVFYIYGGAILGFIALSTFLDAALFLSKRGVIEPLYALFLPFFVIFITTSGIYLWKTSN